MLAVHKSINMCLHYVYVQWDPRFNVQMLVFAAPGSGKPKHREQDRQHRSVYPALLLWPRHGRIGGRLFLCLGKQGHLQFHRSFLGRLEERRRHGLL